MPKKLSTPKKSFLSVLWFATRFLWSVNPRLFIAVILINSINSLVIIPNLLLDKYFIDILVSGIGSPVPNLVFRSILVIVALRFGLSMFRTLSQRLSGYYARMYFMRTYQKLETTVGEKYATISVPLLESPAFKDRYNRLEREGLNRLQRVGENLVRVPQHFTAIASSLSFFVLSQPLIVLFSLISLLPQLIVDRIFIRKDYELDQEIGILHRKRGMYYYYLGRTRSYLEGRLLNIFHYLSQKIWFFWDIIIGKRLSLMRARRTWGFLAGIADNAVSYSFDAVFAFQAIIGQITIGTAQAYIRAISTFKQSVNDLSANFMELYESHLYLSDLQWFLSLDSPYYNDSGLIIEANNKIQIRFQNVWFKYPGTSTWVLKGVNAAIDPRQNIALVGKNGVGKTTFVKLLCGFYEPTKGKILINGIPVTKLNKPKYWEKLSVLFQDSDGFGITMDEVIAASDTTKVEDTKLIRKYAQKSQIDDWIQSLPLKYKTPMSRDFEQGVSPSSGQWQRIVIARALLKDPELLVLDEPTSNIDPEAEEKIFNEVITYGLDKIILFISHRFSTVRRADKILVMDDGHLIEQGSHEELMGLGGLYSKLFSLQAKSYQ